MSKPSCPQSSISVLDDSFLDCRAKLLDIAALLDRVDRCSNPSDARQDFRYRALCKGLELLVKAQNQRAKQLLDLWSDPTEAPLESAAGLKGAYGAWKGDAR